MKNNQSLSDRIKKYENCFRYYLPARNYVILRLDIRSGHSYCKGLMRPFDDNFIDDFDQAAIQLCEEVQNCRLCYLQSDECNIFIDNRGDINKEAWFDNNIQKIVSISAATLSVAFNRIRWKRGVEKECVFDSRCFIVNELEEVANTILWRVQDASRNSIQMLARSLVSRKECENLNTSQLNELCFQRGHNWNNLAPRYKRGRLILKNKYEIPNEYKKSNSDPNIITRHKWEITDIPDKHDFEYWYDLLKQLTNNEASLANDT